MDVVEITKMLHSVALPVTYISSQKPTDMTAEGTSQNCFQKFIYHKYSYNASVYTLLASLA